MSLNISRCRLVINGKICNHIVRCIYWFKKSWRDNVDYKFSIRWNSRERRHIASTAAISVRDFRLFDTPLSYNNAIKFCDENNGRLTDTEYTSYLERHIHNFTTEEGYVWMYNCTAHDIVTGILYQMDEQVCNDFNGYPFCQFDQPANLPEELRAYIAYT